VTPLVIGHRGASAYRPENTLEAFELAFRLGADAIEFDVVPTVDGQLIIRHEPELTGTTDVASVPSLADKARVDEWFSHDLTLSEVKLLHARERLAAERSGSAAFDGQFLVPSLDELLAADFIAGKTLVLEIKHGDEYLAAGIDLVAMVAKALAAADWQARGVTLIVEAFDYETLQRAKLALGSVAQYVYLVEHNEVALWGSPGECLVAATQAGFDGVSFDKRLVTRELVRQAHAAGLSILAYTLRAEEAENSVEEYYAHYIELGLDGLFADHPDLLRQVVDGLA
jgi:glycerophosphoryl diester phosphodiesterase